MSPNPQRLLSGLSQHADTLTQRLQTLHLHLLDTVSAVDRIACALYDAQEDALKTFINSTRAGRAISGYEYKLSDSQALSALARSGEFRVLDDIAQMVREALTGAIAVLNRGEHGAAVEDKAIGVLVVMEKVSIKCKVPVAFWVILRESIFEILGLKVNFSA